MLRQHAHRTYDFASGALLDKLKVRDERRDVRLGSDMARQARGIGADKGEVVCRLVEGAAVDELEQMTGEIHHDKLGWRQGRGVEREMRGLVRRLITRQRKGK